MCAVYLTVSIVCVSVFALCYKVAARMGCELRAVNMWMCISATAVLAANFAVEGPSYNSTAAILGLFAGVCAYFSTISFFYHMRTGCLALSWSVIGMAVAFPVAASILGWHEHPTVKQWIGLSLIPVAFVLFGMARRATG